MDINPSCLRIDTLRTPFLNEKKVDVKMLRLDLIDPVVSGNKWFKLKYQLQAALEQGKRSVLSFGGAYSNHLLALAAACQKAGLESIGLVRGHHGKLGNSTLEACQNFGMHLQFLDRKDYRMKDDPQFLADLQRLHPEAWIVPEGGNNELGRRGAEEIARFLPAHCNVATLAVGSGATLSGLRAALPLGTSVLGFAPFKNAEHLKETIRRGLPPGHTNWQLTDRYHFGGFAKRNEELISFLRDFYAQFQIPLDFIYTGKMMFGLFDLIKKDQFPKNTTIVAIHTGGLQGNKGINLDLLTGDS